jgi:DNA-binding CsgD family transcriptional regulator
MKDVFIGTVIHMRQLLSADFATEFLRSIRGLLPVSGISYYVVDEYGRPFGHQLNGLPLDHLREYRAVYYQWDPLHPSQHQNAERDVITLEQACRWRDATPYVEGFLHARGYFDEVELFLRDASGVIVSGIGLFREERDGPFRSGELDLLNRVRPVLELAVRSRVHSPDASSAWEAFSARYELTGREIEIIGQLRRGASNREIAERLGITVATVKAHLFNVFKKTGTTSRTDLLSRLLDD